MATDPDWQPVDEEAAEMLAANPELREELKGFDRAYEADEAELMSDEEVRRHLVTRGVNLAPRPPHSESGPVGR